MKYNSSYDTLLPKLFRLNLIKLFVLTLDLQEIQSLGEQVKQYHKGPKVHKVRFLEDRWPGLNKLLLRETKGGGYSTFREA